MFNGYFSKAKRSSGVVSTLEVPRAPYRERFQEECPVCQRKLWCQTVEVPGRVKIVVIYRVDYSNQKSQAKIIFTGFHVMS